MEKTKFIGRSKGVISFINHNILFHYKNNDGESKYICSCGHEMSEEIKGKKLYSCKRCGTTHVIRTEYMTQQESYIVGYGTTRQEDAKYILFTLKPYYLTSYSSAFDIEFKELSFSIRINKNTDDIQYFDAFMKECNIDTILKDLNQYKEIILRESFNCSGLAPIWSELIKMQSKLNETTYYEEMDDPFGKDVFVSISFLFQCISILKIKDEKDMFFELECLL